MIIDHKKIELYGKPLLHKVIAKSPFEFDFPLSKHACLFFSLKGDMQLDYNEEQIDVPATYSLFLNCINTTKKLRTAGSATSNEVVIINFHPDVLKKIYERDLPSLLQQPGSQITNQSVEKINSDFLIQKYIEGLLFYFENPRLINDEILILKLKEIVLLLSQTNNAEMVKTILSQLFSPVTYTFKQVIEGNIFSQASIEELAQKTNLSLSSFKREFSKLYNDSPANYIKNKRLEKAAELLLVSDQRITEIAFECGFNDLANFTKSFHDKYNVAPTAYRSQKAAQ